MDEIQTILDKVLAGERIFADECAVLLDSPDVARIGAVAFTTPRHFRVPSSTASSQPLALSNVRQWHLADVKSRSIYVR